MGPVTAPATNPTLNANILSKNLEQIGSKSDTEIQSRSRVDAVQPQGVELSRSQSTKPSAESFKLVEQSEQKSAPSPSRVQQRGSLLDVSA